MSLRRARCILLYADAVRAAALRRRAVPGGDFVRDLTSSSIGDAGAWRTGWACPAASGAAVVRAAAQRRDRRGRDGRPVLPAEPWCILAAVRRQLPAGSVRPFAPGPACDCRSRLRCRAPVALAPAAGCIGLCARPAVERGRRKRLAPRAGDWVGAGAPAAGPAELVAPTARAAARGSAAAAAPAERAASVASGGGTGSGGATGGGGVTGSGGAAVDARTDTPGTVTDAADANGAARRGTGRGTGFVHAAGRGRRLDNCRPPTPGGRPTS